MQSSMKQIHILLVEDEPAHVELIRRAFESTGNNNLRIAATLHEAREILNTSLVHLIISDIRLPDGDCAALLHHSSNEKTYPVIIMTSFGDEALAVKAMKAGAADYIVKSDNSLGNMPMVADRVMREWELGLEKKRTSAKQEQLLAMMEATPDLIATADKDNYLTYINTAGRKLLKIEGENLHKFQLVDFHAPHDARLVLKVGIPTAIRVGSWKKEILLRTRDNEEIAASLVIISHKDEHGEISYFSFIIRDRRFALQAEKEKRDLEEQLLRAQKMEAIGLMAGGVAHDLNNILSAIIGYPELLLRSLPEDSGLREPILAIKDSGQRAATVVADLLTVARGAVSTRETYDLNILIQEYLNSLEHKNLTSLYPKVLFQQHIGDTQPNILCSPVHIKKILMNLLTNASEAIIDDGVVTISTTVKSIDTITDSLRNLAAGNYVVLTVLDSGPGIAEAHMERIFEPFYTNKVMGRSGTGLGLAIVWNTVQDHKGQIVVQSSKKGTSFELYFPVIKSSKIIPYKEKEQENIMGNKEHLLVVDDDPRLRALATKLLQALGYTADSVSSGESAVEYVKKKPVDLLVIDMLMDPGMNGRHTYEKITRIVPKQKAIIASGFSKSADVEAALQFGVKEFIKKPYSLHELGRTVKKALAD